MSEVPVKEVVEELLNRVNTLEDKKMYYYNVTLKANTSVSSAAHRIITALSFSNILNKIISILPMEYNDCFENNDSWLSGRGGIDGYYYKIFLRNNTSTSYAIAKGAIVGILITDEELSDDEITELISPSNYISISLATTSNIIENIETLSYKED